MPKGSTSPYNSTTRKTIEMLTGSDTGLSMYTVNQFYKSKNNIIYYINQRGYYHVLKTSRFKYNIDETKQKHGYIIYDMLLKPNNSLEETSRETFYNKEDFIKRCEEIENNCRSAVI